MPNPPSIGTLTRSFYLADPEVYLELLRELGADVRTAMVVGHNPGMEELVELLTGRDEIFPTAALARVELAIDRWVELSPGTRGRLVSLWRPKELPDQEP